MSARVVALLVGLAGCGRSGFDATGNVDAAADAGDASVADAGVRANWMFVTSAVYAPSSITSLAQADVICANHATAAQLDGTFVAWLSLDGVNARDRIAVARGWVRPDGAPFVDQVNDLIGGRIFMPARIDELGADVASSEVYTGTSSSGAIAGSSCAGSGMARVGVTQRTIMEWTSSGDRDCTTPVRLYCFAIDRAVAVAPVPVAGRRAFISTVSFDPTTGVGGADARCAAEAAAAGLPGAYKALIGTSTASALSRFSLAGGPWVRLDGIALASSISAFAAGDLATPLNVTTTGAYVGDHVATGGGTPETVPSLANTCDDWSSAAGTARMGRARASGPASFSSSTQPCDVPYAVYCLAE
jgi:hypothetical protein